MTAITTAAPKAHIKEISCGEHDALKNHGGHSRTRRLQFGT
jgi:hypothetical protein